MEQKMYTEAEVIHFMDQAYLKALGGFEAGVKRGFIDGFFSATYAYFCYKGVKLFYNWYQESKQKQKVEESPKED
jgi:hypothetical protein